MNKHTNNEIGTWATLKKTSPFFSIFPDPNVPIISILPIIPREHGAPRCYLINASKLTEDTLLEVARVFFGFWEHECNSIEEMLEYLRKNFPLNVEHFSDCWTTDPAFLFGLMDDHGILTDDEEEYELMRENAEYLSNMYEDFEE